MIGKLKCLNPTKEQAEAMTRDGVNRAVWAVLSETKESLILRHRITGEIKVIGK